MIKWKLAQFFELLWWRKYFLFKTKDSYYTWKKNYWQSLVSSLKTINITDKNTIADLGCGPAGIFILFDKNEVIAVDPLLEKYKKNLSFFDPSTYPNVNFFDATIEDFVCKEKFDFVFCMNAINHVANIQKAFQKICDLSSDKLIVSIDAHNHNFLKTIFRLIPGDILHPHQYNLEEYKTFLSERNFKIIETNCIKKDFIFNHYILVAQKNE